MADTDDEGSIIGSLAFDMEKAGTEFAVEELEREAEIGEFMAFEVVFMLLADMLDTGGIQLHGCPVNEAREITWHIGFEECHGHITITDDVFEGGVMNIGHQDHYLYTLIAV